MTALTLLTDGIAFGESPRFVDGRLLVADWAAQELLAVGADGGREVVADVPSFPFCVDRLPDGRLLVVNAAAALLQRREPDGSFATHADLGALAAGTPWNDIVVDRDGNAFVNNLGFRFMEEEPGTDPAPGLLAVVTPDGALRQVADDLAFPNGMAVLPDERTLVVAESYAGRLTAFDITAGGGLENRRVWADLGDAAPDGICADADGAIWYADVPHRRCVRVAEGGEVLATVDADRGCFACMLGGPDGRTLYVVAQEWPPAEDGRRTGRVLTATAPAPAAGRPLSG
jgi:sugar lactone lactonase YvrE